MKRYIYFLLMITLFITFGNTCKDDIDNCHRSIDFINNSENAIYIRWDYEYPDTFSFSTGPSPALNPQIYKVNSNTTSNKPFLISRDCWEYLFGDLIASDTLMVFVFDAEVLESEEWSNVVHDYMVLKRYDLSLEDLNRMNWTITYP